MTPVILTWTGSIIAGLSFLALVAWALWYFTRDTGTHAAPRRDDGWDEPPPAAAWPPPQPTEWLPVPEMAHDEEALDAWHHLLNERQVALDEREAALDERLSGVIVADVYTPTPPGPPGDDYGWREPFAWWLSDTNVGGMLAITEGGPLAPIDIGPSALPPPPLPVAGGRFAAREAS